MRRRILDTNRLINHWGRCRARHGPRAISTERAKSWADELIEIEDAQTILTPIYIEYLCGQTTAEKVRLAQAFLNQFKIVDRGMIQDTDWQLATRIAARVRPSGGRRQMGDCLIRAVADRLGFEIRTGDRGFPRRVPAGN